MTDDALRYPVGRFTPRERLSADERTGLIGEIAAAPGLLRAAVTGLSDAQLDTPYRPGGWTVRQVAHHVPDSHVNAYVRCRLALTEEHPTVKPYDEAAWATLADATHMPVAPSLALLDSLHDRWVTLLRALDEAAFRRTLLHPANGVMTIDAIVALYAWHGRHHTAHVTRLRERNGW